MILGLVVLMLVSVAVSATALAVMGLSSRIPRRLPSRRAGASLMGLVGILLVGVLLAYEDVILDWVTWSFEAGRDGTRGPTTIVAPAKGLLAALLAVPLLFGLKFFVCTVVAVTWHRHYGIRRTTAWLGCIASFYALYLTAAWLFHLGLLGRTRWGLLEKFSPQALAFLALWHLLCWACLGWSFSDSGTWSSRRRPGSSGPGDATGPAGAKAAGNKSRCPNCGTVMATSFTRCPVCLQSMQGR